MFGVGYGEVAILGLIAVLLFGSRATRIMRDLGRSIAEFKRGLRDSDGR